MTISATWEPIKSRVPWKTLCDLVDRLDKESPPPGRNGEHRNGTPASPRPATLPAGPKRKRPPVAKLAPRIRKYLATVPGAVSGQGGHNDTLRTCGNVVHGFDLTPDEAWEFLAEWNAKCEPPWEDNDLRRKLDEAKANPGDRPAPGYLIWARRGIDDPSAGPDADRPSDPTGGGSAGDDLDPATLLFNAARGRWQFFRTPDGDTLATGDGRTAVRILSREFASRLRLLAQRQNGGTVPARGAVEAAIAQLDAVTSETGPTREAFIRTAEQDGVVYVHLADAANTVVRVGPDGWAACDRPPVVFLATRKARPLPLPERGGSMADLRPFLNVRDDDEFDMVVAWLTAAYRAERRWPTKMLSLVGGEGTAKSGFAKTLVSLVDPQVPDVRQVPLKPEDVHVAARHSWLLAYDNLSGIDPWLADALCVIVTGGGHSTRTLYSTTDETVFEARRPVLLTGVTRPTDRADFNSRVLPVHLAPITDERRVTERSLTARWEAVRPRVLGAIFDLLAVGLRNESRLPDSGYERMADFAKWTAAVLGEEKMRQHSEQAIADAHQAAVEGSLIAKPLADLMANETIWTGTATELLQKLTEVVTRDGRDLPKRWPSQPNLLSNQLARIAAPVRTVHCLDIDSERVGKGGARVIRIKRLTATPSNSSPPSAEPTPSSAGAVHRQPTTQDISATQQPNATTLGDILENIE